MKLGLENRTITLTGPAPRVPTVCTELSLWGALQSISTPAVTILLVYGRKADASGGERVAQALEA